MSHPAPRVLAPLARADVVLQTMRHEARQRHEDWRQHAYYDCSRCLSGQHCREGNRLCDLADDAGKRLERSEERMKREARP